MKFPKITIDPSSLRRGYSGNTWKEWGYILLAFAALYALLAGYMTGLLFAAKGIRQDNYRAMSGNYFGPFLRTLYTAPVVPLPSTGGSRDPFFFNRPTGCSAQQVSQPLAGVPDVTVSRPNGILDCSNSGDQWRWTVYPWVVQTDGLDRYPGCSNPAGTQSTGYSYLDSASSPAAQDAGNATEADQDAWVCQNGVPTTAAAQ